MSAILVKFAMSCRDKRLNAMERFILCRLAEFFDEYGKISFLGLKRLGMDLGSSKPTIIKHLKRLPEKDYLKKIGLPKMQSEYHLNIEKIKQNSGGMV